MRTGVDYYRTQKYDQANMRIKQRFEEIAILCCWLLFFSVLFVVVVLHHLIPTSIPLTRFHKQINIDPLRGHHNLLIPLLFFSCFFCCYRCFHSPQHKICHTYHIYQHNTEQCSFLFVVVLFCFHVNAVVFI